MTDKRVTTSEFVLSLHDAVRAPVQLVGGKVAGFRFLVDAGLDFPPGFVVTADAHRRAKAAGWADGSPLPEELAGAIRTALAGLPDAYLVVRSSAVAEDGRDASFAGQFETLVAVARDEVEDAVRACWESAGAARVRAYAGSGEHAMAVLVQSLVEADAAGVVVTADPLTGDQQTLVVNASFGLGEAVVSGIVTPDEYRLARADGAVVGFVVGDKELALVRGPGGLREEPLSDERRALPALASDQLESLWRGALAAETALGRPADLEFAVQGGRLLWLQCRPLTALPDKEDR